MKMLVSVTMFLLCPASQASDFRFCDMEGTVQTAAPHPGKKPRVYDLMVGVSTAHVDQRSDIGGYTDCSEFVGGVVEVRLQIPRRFAPPVTGDKIRFKYSQVDGSDAGGNFSGSSTNASLTSYRRPTTPPGR